MTDTRESVSGVFLLHPLMLLGLFFFSGNTNQEVTNTPVNDGHDDGMVDEDDHEEDGMVDEDDQEEDGMVYEDDHEDASEDCVEECYEEYPQLAECPRMG